MNPVPLKESRVLRWTIAILGLVLVLSITQELARPETNDLISAGTAGSTLRRAVPILLAGLGGIWAERANAEYVKHKENADPAAVAFDAVAAASARGCDLVLIDTAGRLHTKVNLMEELKKIKRTVAKQLEGAPHETLLVLDATTGQNALSQAKLFNDALDISGLVLTKLDGTAKGGIVIGICSALNIPLQYIGIGEQIEDLRPFDANQFIEALF